MDRRLFGSMSWDALHTPATGDPIRRRVIVDLGVQRSGFDVQRVGSADEGSFLLSEGPRPGKGDVVEILETGERFTADAQVSNDGAVVVVTLRRVSGG